ncbi:MAG: riboflavin synthase [Hyphomicrobiales bacterium]|nr:riboflavin synthase [Hyphomicrobiales bacterium]
MFTGIIIETGIIRNLIRKDSEIELSIFSKNIKPIKDGMSISCAGICLTVTSYKELEDGVLFTVYISSETTNSTSIAEYNLGDLINLEKSLSLGDEMSGHIVQGHIDSTAEIIEKYRVSESTIFKFKTQSKFMKYIVPKGSVALDGTSLTVNHVNNNNFDINIIPYTLEHTTWNIKEVGDKVNLEIDLVARYVVHNNKSNA